MSKRLQKSRQSSKEKYSSGVHSSFLTAADSQSHQQTRKKSKTKGGKRAVGRTTVSSIDVDRSKSLSDLLLPYGISQGQELAVEEVEPHEEGSEQLSVSEIPNMIPGMDKPMCPFEVSRDSGGHDSQRRLNTVSMPDVRDRSHSANNQSIMSIQSAPDFQKRVKFTPVLEQNVSQQQEQVDKVKKQTRATWVSAVNSSAQAPAPQRASFHARRGSDLGIMNFKRGLYNMSPLKQGISNASHAEIQARRRNLQRSPGGQRLDSAKKYGSSGHYCHKSKNRGSSQEKKSRFELESEVSALKIELEESNSRIESLKATLVAVTKKLNTINDSKQVGNLDLNDPQLHNNFDEHISELKQRIENLVQIIAKSGSQDKSEMQSNPYIRNLLDQITELKLQMQESRSEAAQEKKELQFGYHQQCQQLRDHILTIKQEHIQQLQQLADGQSQASVRMDEGLKMAIEAKVKLEAEHKKVILKLNQDWKQKVAAKDVETTKKLQELNEEWNRKMTTVQEEHIKRVKTLNNDWCQKVENAIQQKESELHHLNSEKIDLQARLDTLKQQTEKAGPGNHTQCFLELEHLKVAQLQEMKLLSNQIETQRQNYDVEKLKIIEENEHKSVQQIQDYKQSLERQEQLEKQVRELEKEQILSQAKILELQGPTGGIDGLVERINKLQDSRMVLKNDLEDATQMIIQMEEKLKATANSQIEQMKRNAHTEEENRKLLVHVKDLKKRVPGELYVPMKHDQVDQMLGKYLNGVNNLELSFPKAMFRREAEGIYYFGTKKIYLKLLNDHIMVRVGGGYQALNEFVMQHGEEEMHKMEREDIRNASTTNDEQHPTNSSIMCSNMASTSNDQAQQVNSSILNGSSRRDRSGSIVQYGSFTNQSGSRRRQTKKSPSLKRSRHRRDDNQPRQTAIGRLQQKPVSQLSQIIADGERFQMFLLNHSKLDKL